MDSIDEKRFFSMAEAYDNMAHLLVPQYEFFQDEIIATLALENYPNATIVDLSAGSGIFLEKVLQNNAGSTCYWVDYSQDFLTIAKNKLSRFGDRVKFILSPIEDSWDAQLDQSPNFIVSMSAIHHLDNKEKKALYKKCFEVLSGTGWFINLDEMKTVYNDAYVNSLYYWVNHVEKSRLLIPDNKKDLYHKWKDHFDNWKSRNIKNIDKPKSKGDDLHETFTLQMEWLKRIGFSNVDLFLKYHLWCAIGGQKSTTSALK